MDQYNVTGMSCAACQTRVEKAVNAVDGVETCAVSLLTNSMGVEGTASSDEIIKAVEAAGYGASLKGKTGSGSSGSAGSDSLKDTETPLMKKRLAASVIFLIPLMYVSMGHMMWNWPLPGFLEGNHIAVGIYELLISGIIMVINQKFFISGFRGVIHRSPNMDTLVSMGAGASFLYSTFALFKMTGAVMAGDEVQTAALMNQFYFESAAMILTLITAGKMLEARSKGKTTDALKSLMNLAPKTAVILSDGKEITVPAEKVKKGDRFVVRPGDSIPADGIVTEGESAVNESSLTGESVPVDKKAGDSVFAATVNTSGYMVCEASGVGEDTTLAGIIKLVSDAAATKAPIARLADRVSGVFVPAVIAVSVITFAAWLIAGQTAGYAVARAVSVLVISCPCALGLATPVAIMVGNGVSAKSGILFKTAASLEMVGKTQIIALDKTGTVTSGEMKVTDVIPADGVSEDELLETAYSLEIKSEHPISGAVVKYAEYRSVSALQTENFEAVSGNGLKAEINGELSAGGNPEFIREFADIPETVTEQKIKELSECGKTPVLFAKNGRFLGITAVADTIKEDSAEAIAQLKNMGIHVVMLTGDNEVTAAAIAKQAGIDEVAASVKPEGKEEVIRQLMERGITSMVGDGINDAPALTRAHVGIAIGAGTDIAAESADIVLLKSSLKDAAAAVRISRAALKNIHQNLFWAFFYNCLGIPLAAGCYAAALGWELSPVFGAAAMGLSSFCVVSNALRLNLINPYDGTKDRKIKDAVSGRLLNNKTNDADYSAGKEEKIMKIKVEGMMCSHCEAHVKKALEALEGIENVTASHDTNTVTFTSSGDVDEKVIKKAVTDAGYQYKGIED